MSVWFALALLVLVVLQGMLGMLTVTWLLKPLIVTGHLLGGLTTFALLLWLWLSMRARSASGRRHDGAGRQPAGGSRRPRAPVGGARAGGARASRCPSVAGPAATTRRSPARTCRSARTSGSPRRTTRTRSCLWRGLGINYAGGVLDHPARVAIHFTHRVGRDRGDDPAAARRVLCPARASEAAPRWAALAVSAALALQISIGVFMVLRAFPLELAAAHNAGAALLVGSHGAAQPQAPAGGRFSLDRLG